MNRFEKMKAIHEELREMARKYDIKIITAVQPPRPRGTISAPIDLTAPVFIDHIGFVR